MAGRTIVITAAEACPYAYVGDLGTTVSSLAEALSSAGHTVHLFIPRYASVFSGSRAFTRHEKKLEVRYPGHEYDAALYTDTVSASFHIHAIEHNLFFERDSIYGPPYSDNCERFSFFSHALFHALDLLDIKPDIIHCFDWHTALVPVLARTLYDTSRIRFAAVVLTIHSIRHTGIFPASAVTVTGLSWDAVTEDNMKYYTQISLLKGGMQYADLLSTVSVTYAKDIINPAESGHLAGIVYAKGIVPVNSGFSAGGWDPSQDKKIDALFSMSDMAGKRVCKTALQRHFGLPLDDDAALFGLTGPFTRENMMPQAARIIGYTAARSRVQFVLMGDGDDDTFLLLEYLNSIMPDRVHIHRGRDETLERRILAGSDFMLITPVLEYTGQAHFRACAYGALPVASRTGLLADTLKDCREPSGGNALLFDRNDPAALRDTLDAAVSLFHSSDLLHDTVHRAMNTIRSWSETAREFTSVYSAALERRRNG